MKWPSLKADAFPPLPNVERQYITAMTGSMTHALLCTCLERRFIDPPEQRAELVY